MITLEYNNKKYEVKSDISELIVSEFEQISNILNTHNDETDIDKKQILNMLNYYNMWFEILEILNVPTEIIDNLTESEFWQIVKSLNIIPKYEEFYIDSLEIDNEHFYVEKRPNGTIKFTIGMIKNIQQNIILHSTRSMSYILAEIFKSDTLNVDERVMYLQNANVMDMLPYITLANNKIIENFKNMINGNNLG